MGGVAGVIGAVTGGITLANDVFGGGGSSSGGQGYYGGSQAPPTYVPTGQPQADTNYQQILSQFMNAGSGIPGQLYPQYQQYVGQIASNPYIGEMQNTANTAASYGTNTLFPQTTQGSTNLQNLSNAAVPYANQILQTGFDPQNALYGRTLQQLQDQINASQAARGITTSPYGADLANEALGNFNINWQNNLLNRENTAAQGYGNLLSGVGQGYAGAAQLGAGGAQTLAQLGALPYGTYNQPLTTNLSALDSLSQAGLNTYQLPQQTLQDLQSYLQLGQSGQSLALRGAAQNFAQQQQLGQGFGNALSQIGQGFSGLDSLFGSSSGGGGVGSSTGGGLADLAAMFGGG